MRELHFSLVAEAIVIAYAIGLAMWVTHRTPVLRTRPRRLSRKRATA